MKTRAANRSLAYLVILCMLWVLATPVFAAEQGAEPGLGAQIEMGRGTSEDNPILIDSAERLVELSRAMSTLDLNALTCAGAYYKQTKDINLSGRSWNPIGGNSISFTGQFDGGGKTISGLTRTSGSVYGGLFGSINNAVLKNIRLSNLSIGITSGKNIIIGGLTGVAQSSKITGCSVSGTIVVNGGDKETASVMVGGVVGVADASNLTGCSFSGSVSAKSANNPVGGIVGMSLNGGSISNCASLGNVKSAGGIGRAGGIIGWGNGGALVQGCYSTGNVVGDLRAGGIAGAIYMGSVIGCYSTSAVNCNGGLYAGGIVGRAQGDNGVQSYIVGCYATGNVSASNGVKSAGDCGGIVSLATDTVVANCAALNRTLTGVRDSRRVYSMDDNSIVVENNAAWSGMLLEGKLATSETNDNGRSLTTRGSALAEELQEVLLDYSSGTIDFVASDYWTFEAGRLPALKNGGVNQPTAMPSWLQ